MRTILRDVTYTKLLDAQFLYVLKYDDLIIVNIYNGFYEVQSIPHLHWVGVLSIRLSLQTNSMFF